MDWPLGSKILEIKQKIPAIETETRLKTDYYIKQMESNSWLKAFLAWMLNHKFQSYMLSNV